jgi:hypothetical protein
MTDYRAVVDHVGYWRGTIHRWSTSYSFTGSGTAPNTAACSTLLLADDKMCYTPTTSLNGGTYECRIYAASGGVPIASYTRFDWTIPGDWIAFNGSGWGATHTVANATQMECALLVEWAAGVSSTGKPVNFRKWYHAVKASVAPGEGLGDILTADITTLTTQAEAVATCLAPTYGLVMGNARRLAGTSPVVSSFYVNHQMPKGRKRKLVVLGGSGIGLSPSDPVIIE